MASRRVKVLFVCMGNICRSPTAEAVFRRTVERLGLDATIDCDSAGTHDYHIGEPPDERACRAALQRGYDMSALRARQVNQDDFGYFDHILAMDRDNLELLKQACPAEHRHKLALYCDSDEKHAGQEVPDPYFGGGRGFERVLDMIEQVSARLADRLGRRPAVKKPA